MTPEEQPQLTRQVLPPREALCDSCLTSEWKRRRTIARAIWMTVAVIVFARLLEAWSW